MNGPPRIDHVVVNARFDLAGCAGRFTALGFTLTPRGHHTLGSMNHLMVLGPDYLEILGLPPGDGSARPEVAAAPPGWNGLVFKSDDVDATHAHLEATGLAGDPPRVFSRPVELPDGSRDASFRTVLVRPGTFPAGRVYFCEHGTPELVWRDEWRDHRNGAVRITEVVVAGPEPEREAERFGQLLALSPSGGGDDGTRLDLDGACLAFLSPARYQERFGRLASDIEGRESVFGAIRVETRDLGAAAGLVAGLDGAMPGSIETDRVAVRVPEFDTVLEFAA